MLDLSEVIMKFLKYLGALTLTAVFLFVFVANFSSATSSFECSGEISFNGDSHPITIYIVLEEYRWWVGLWSDSDGNIQLEIPNETTMYYSHVVEVETQLKIYNSPKDLKGNLSTLSKILALSTPFGFFDGKCKSIN